MTVFKLLNSYKDELEGYLNQFGIDYTVRDAHDILVGFRADGILERLFQWALDDICK
jgi:hypothetical protein